MKISIENMEKRIREYQLVIYSYKELSSKIVKGNEGFDRDAFLIIGLKLSGDKCSADVWMREGEEYKVIGREDIATSTFLHHEIIQRLKERGIHPATWTIAEVLRCLR